MIARPPGLSTRRASAMASRVSPVAWSTPLDHTASNVLSGNDSAEGVLGMHRLGLDALDLEMPPRQAHGVFGEIGGGHAHAALQELEAVDIPSRSQSPAGACRAGAPPRDRFAA